MKFAALLFALSTPALAGNGLTITCQKGEHSLVATVNPKAGPAGELTYHVGGPNYAYDGFVMNDPKATYVQSAEVKNGEFLSVEAELAKTETVNYSECVKSIPNSRACGEYVHGPHPQTTLSQSFSLQLGPDEVDGYKVNNQINYLYIWGANPDFPGSYQFTELKGAACTFTGEL